MGYGLMGNLIQILVSSLSNPCHDSLHAQGMLQ